MKLTIIPSDEAVYKDEISILGLDLKDCGIPPNVHALQWVDVKGSIEYKTSDPNEEITVLPQWALNCVDVWNVAYEKQINPPPPPPPPAEANKAYASKLLYDTDWTTIPDVADSTKSNPYLSNVDEFIVYRNAVRQYAINPVEGNINWPDKPSAIWTTSE